MDKILVGGWDATTTQTFDVVLYQLSRHPRGE